MNPHQHGVIHALTVQRATDRDRGIAKQIAVIPVPRHVQRFESYAGPPTIEGKRSAGSWKAKGYLSLYSSWCKHIMSYTHSSVCCMSSLTVRSGRSCVDHVLGGIRGTGVWRFTTWWGSFTLHSVLLL